LEKPEKDRIEQIQKRTAEQKAFCNCPICRGDQL